MESAEEVVFLDGCWDLFHIGHLNIIEKASRLGFLVLGVVTDEGMRSMGKTPIIPYEQRRAIVAALRCVDVVVPYFHYGDITGIMECGATTRVIGPEHLTVEKNRQARDKLVAMGVKYVEIPRTPGVSTTLIKQAYYQMLQKEKCDER